MHRLQLATLHFNENSGREQAVTREGNQSYEIVYPKYKKGGYVVRKVTVEPTYSKFNLVLYTVIHVEVIDIVIVYLQSIFVNSLMKRLINTLHNIRHLTP